MTVSRSSTPSSTRRPSAITASCSAVGKIDMAISSTAPPLSRWAVRATRMPTSSAFQSLQAAGPVAMESASVSASSSCSERRLADPLGDPADGALVGEVAPGRDVGQQQVVADHLGELGDVVGVVAHALADAGDDLDADVDVVARVALADVVQQRAHHEQVGAVDPVDEGRGVGRRLAQVTVDGEAVVGVALRLAAHRLPLRQDAHPQAPLVERLDHVDGRPAGEQQVGEEVTGLLAPRDGQVGRLGGQAVERGAVDAGVGLGRRHRDSQHEQADRPPDRPPR